MRATFGLNLALILILSALTVSPSRAYEMLGLFSYNFSNINPKPTLYSGTKNEIGYTFLGRIDLGPGLLESGFQFIPTSISTQQAFGELKTTGSYWILPLMYRYVFFPPFFSVAAGVDYAVVGSTNLSVSGNQVAGLTSGYQSHFGVQASLEANQDLGENLSLVLDLRYRQGLATAISFNNVGSHYNFFIIGLGIQKHLE